MKNYEIELKELQDWCRAEMESASELSRNSHGILDGPGTKKSQQTILEYNKRLSELKKKYNVD